MEIATNIAIIATTTKSSTKVKPLSRTFFFIRTHVSLSSYICSVHNYIKFYRNVNTNEEHTLAGVAFTLWLERTYYKRGNSYKVKSNLIKT